MKKYRYFAGFMKRQQAWLNDMASQGYRLVKTGKVMYEFEACKPNQYVYCIDFVAHKSMHELTEYKQFLETIGYRVMSKNINMNWSIGHIRVRPYGEGSGKVATSPGTYNKELLIVEKVNDEKPFQLHTTLEDQLAYYTFERNAYLSSVLLALFLFLWIIFTSSFQMQYLLFLILGIIMAIPTLLLQKEIIKLKKKQI